MFSPLIPLSHAMVVVDPPWAFDLYSEEGEAKSASAHYDTMPDEEILALPVGELAAMHSMVLLWVSAGKLGLGLQCLQAWGFQYKSYLVWRKVTRKGKLRWGTGYRVRSTAEIVLIGAIGNPPQAYRPPTTFDGVAREHSRKPEEFYALCDRMMPHARRADIFARETRDGWHAWGWEADRFKGEADGGAIARRPKPPKSISTTPLFDGDQHV